VCCENRIGAGPEAVLFGPSDLARLAHARRTIAFACRRGAHRAIGLATQTQLRGDAVVADNEQPTLLPLAQVEQERTEVAGSLSLVVHSTSPAPAAPRACVAGGAEDRYYLVVSDRANADVTTHMQLYAVNVPARDPGGSPFAWESRYACPRERRALELVAAALTEAGTWAHARAMRAAAPQRLLAARGSE
jgi:hypothetical protein